MNCFIVFGLLSLFLSFSLWGQSSKSSNLLDSNKNLGSNNLAGNGTGSDLNGSNSNASAPLISTKFLESESLLIFQTMHLIPTATLLIQKMEPSSGKAKPSHLIKIISLKVVLNATYPPQLTRVKNFFIEMF